MEGDQVFLTSAVGGCGGERGLAKLLMISDGWRLQNGWRGVAPFFGGRTISFLVKFESSVLCELMANIGLLGYFITHLMNKKADFAL